MASISCASSVSAQKSPHSHSQTDNRSKSCDTVCTSSSSCFFKRRKPMNPLAYSLRPALHKTNTNSIKQRVMSAKMLKLRQLQSQLNDANFHLAEVARENQTLKTLQKRQDKALSKYENTNADLPRLLHSHEEEIKVLTEKNRNLRKNVKELTEQLKQKEEEAYKTREQLEHLEKLDKDKHLTEREKLMEKMEDLKIRLHKSEEQVSTLNRKLVLESKISKQRLNTEIVKHKQCQKELLHAFDEIDRLTGLLDAKENMVRPRNKFNKLQNRDSMSMVTLRHYQTPNRNLSNDRLTTLKDVVQAPVSEVKLEPLVNGINKVEERTRKSNDGFKAPMENIRQRLSSGSMKIPRQDLNGLSNSEISSESRENSADSHTSRPCSSLKLEKLPAVEENHRVRAKMKWEKENRPDENTAKETLEDKTYGENDEANHLENRAMGQEIIDRYDNEKDDNRLISPNDLMRRQINDTDQNKIEKRHNGKKFCEQSENRSDDDSDTDLDNIIEKMKKEKQEERKMLQKSQNNKTENSYISKSSSPDSDKSEEEIERITANLDATIQRVAENSREEFDKKLGNYCSEVLSSVKNCNKSIKMHKEGLESSKKDTNTLIDTFKRTEKVETKLKKSFFSMDDDMNFVKEILNEEYKFQEENKELKHSTLDKNSNIEKGSLVNLDNKKKLLATLRAIDNGDSVESIEDRKHDNFISERFGHVAH